MLSKLIHKIAGDYPKFSIRERATNIFNFLTTINFGIGSAVAICIQLKFVSLLFQLSGFAFFLLLYTLIRQKKIGHYYWSYTAGVALSMMMVGWFLNGGVNGVMITVEVVYFYFILNITLQKRKALISILCASTIYLMLLLNYFHPEWETPYPDILSRYVDIAITVTQLFLYYIFIQASNQYCYEYEQALAKRKTKELEEANQEKVKLFSIISHELKAPVASIRGVLNLMDEDMVKPEEMKKHLNYVSQMTLPLSNTLNNLLLWSRQQLNGISNLAVEISLSELLKEELKLFKNELILKKINIQKELSPDSDAIGDENQIRVVIRNLISNAVRYAAENSKIICSCDCREGLMYFAVSNQGKPIAKEVVEYFNETGKLYQEDDPNKGSGLGLFISREFIISNKGKLWIASSNQNETKFCFNLPKGKL